MSETESRPVKNLAQLVSPWFHFLSTYRSNFHDLPQDPMWLKQQLMILLGEANKATRINRELQEDFELVKPALVYCAEELLSRAHHGNTGMPLNLGLEIDVCGTNIGGSAFFEQCEEASTSSPQIREVYLQCLLMGFEGKYIGKPHRVNEVIQSLYKRHETECSKQIDQKVYPEAYKHTKETPTARPPLMATAAVGGLAFAALIVLTVAGMMILDSKVNALVTQAEESAEAGQ